MPLRGSVHRTATPAFAAPSPPLAPTNFRDPVTAQKMQEANIVELFPAQCGGAAEPVLALVSYGDTHCGYLRIIANAATLRIESHPAEDGSTTKTTEDAHTRLTAPTRGVYSW